MPGLFFRRVLSEVPGPDLIVQYKLICYWMQAVSKAGMSLGEGGGFKAKQQKKQNETETAFLATGKMSPSFSKGNLFGSSHHPLQLPFILSLLFLVIDLVLNISPLSS